MFKEVGFYSSSLLYLYVCGWYDRDTRCNIVRPFPMLFIFFSIRFCFSRQSWTFYASKATKSAVSFPEWVHLPSARYPMQSPLVHRRSWNYCRRAKSDFIKIEKRSCEYDRWVVETQLCKLCDTLDTLIGRACAMFQLKCGCELLRSTYLRHGCWYLRVVPQLLRMVCRSRVLYIYSSWKIQVGDSPGCYQGQQDDFTRTMLSITILLADTI